MAVLIESKPETNPFITEITKDFKRDAAAFNIDSFYEVTLPDLTDDGFKALSDIKINSGHILKVNLPSNTFHFPFNGNTRLLKSDSEAALLICTQSPKPELGYRLTPFSFPELKPSNLH